MERELHLENLFTKLSDNTLAKVAILCNYVNVAKREFKCPPWRVEESPVYQEITKILNDIYGLMAVNDEAFADALADIELDDLALEDYQTDFQKVIGILNSYHHMLTEKVYCQAIKMMSVADMYAASRDLLDVYTEGGIGGGIIPEWCSNPKPFEVD